MYVLVFGKMREPVWKCVSNFELDCCMQTVLPESVSLLKGQRRACEAAVVALSFHEGIKTRLFDSEQAAVEYYQKHGDHAERTCYELTEGDDGGWTRSIGVSTSREVVQHLMRERVDDCLEALGFGLVCKQNGELYALHEIRSDLIHVGAEDDDHSVLFEDPDRPDYWWDISTMDYEVGWNPVGCRYDDRNLSIEEFLNVARSTLTKAA